MRRIPTSNPAQFFIIPECLMSRKDLTPATKIILTRLMHCLFQKKQWSVRDVFPSQSTIATWCGVSREWTCKCIKELERKGLVKVVRRQGASNLYVLTDWLQREWLNLLGLGKEAVRKVKEWFRGEGVKSPPPQLSLLLTTKERGWGKFTPLVKSPITGGFVQPAEVWRQMAEAFA